MIILAVIGLIIGGVPAIILFQKQKTDINVRGAFWHVMETVFGSTAVLIAALLVRYAGSNIRLAGDLKGKLLLIQSTADPHGTFAWTMKLVDALIQAGKPYDLLVLPGQGHVPSGASLTYMLEAIRRYFQEHLKP